MEIINFKIEIIGKEMDNQGAKEKESSFKMEVVIEENQATSIVRML